MNTLEALKAVKAVIDTPEKWTQNGFARDARGHPCDPLSAYATCYCIGGAYRKVDNVKARLAARHILLDSIDELHPRIGRSIIGFNDDGATTHAKVMEVFDHAIERATRGEA